MSKNSLILLAVIIIIIGGAVYWFHQNQNGAMETPSSYGTTNASSSANTIASSTAPTSTPAHPLCPAREHRCQCATGYYCLGIGAMCINSTAACPPASPK